MPISIVSAQEKGPFVDAFPRLDPSATRPFPSPSQIPRSQIFLRVATNYCESDVPRYAQSSRYEPIYRTRGSSTPLVRDARTPF
jgi:hypothetical protein